jgi:phosphate starvation-inducible PhoH-like protein
MVEAIEILRNVEGIRFCYFDEGDVVRHHLVQRIIRAYDDYKGRNEQLSLSLEIKNGNGFATPRSSDGQVPTTSVERETSLAEVPSAEAPPAPQNRVSD